MWSVMAVINTILLATAMIFCRMLSCEAKKQKRSFQRSKTSIFLIAFSHQLSTTGEISGGLNHLSFVRVYTMQPRTIEVFFLTLGVRTTGVKCTIQKPCKKECELCQNSSTKVYFASASYLLCYISTFCFFFERSLQLAVSAYYVVR